MLQTWRRPQRLFSDFNTLQFAGVMCIVLLVPLTLFMTYTTPHHGIGVDLPKAAHSVPMRDASREDAMIVWVTRDGKLYFGSDQVPDSADLPRRIAQRLQDHSVERKVYVKADMRARWGAIKRALDGIRAAGVLRVAFLVDQRRS